MFTLIMYFLINHVSLVLGIINVCHIITGHFNNARYTFILQHSVPGKDIAVVYSQLGLMPVDEDSHPSLLVPQSQNTDLISVAYPCSVGAKHEIRMKKGRKKTPTKHFIHIIRSQIRVLPLCIYCLWMCILFSRGLENMDKPSSF